ncbi:hypothetical protein FACS1894167_15060 [Synergistales bacterium]|nr:hypothetical protein FACS1894167_15060 [Synergistales bacterium]
MLPFGHEAAQEKQRTHRSLSTSFSDDETQFAGQLRPHMPQETHCVFEALDESSPILNGAKRDRTPRVIPTGQQPQKSLPFTDAASISASGKTSAVTRVPSKKWIRALIPRPKFDRGSSSVISGGNDITTPTPTIAGIMYLIPSGLIYADLMPNRREARHISSCIVPRGQRNEQNILPKKNVIRIITAAPIPKDETWVGKSHDRSPLFGAQYAAANKTRNAQAANSRAFLTDLPFGIYRLRRYSVDLQL